MLNSAYAGHCINRKVQHSDSFHNLGGVFVGHSLVHRSPDLRVTRIRVFPQYRQPGVSNKVAYFVRYEH